MRARETLTGISVSLFVVTLRILIFGTFFFLRRTEHCVVCRRQAGDVNFHDKMEIGPGCTVRDFFSSCQTLKNADDSWWWAGVPLGSQRFILGRTWVL